jgi:hypothetical protein
MPDAAPRKVPSLVPAPAGSCSMDPAAHDDSQAVSDGADET